MSLRINHNISAIKGHRYLQSHSNETSENMQRLSSGLKINTAADAPAALVISETMRAKTSGLSQAVENSENAVSLVQTAEAALGEMNRTLNNMRQLAVHASNVGVNDDHMMEADQAEFSNSIISLDRVSNNTQFGSKNLLDGSRGANGVATGRYLQFVDAGSETLSSPAHGYEVKVEQSATQSAITGKQALSQSIIDAGETLTVTEGGKTMQMKTLAGESAEAVFNRLRLELKKADLAVEVTQDESDKFHLSHKDFGSKASFTVASSTAGILSRNADGVEEVQNGKDIQGRINNEEAAGEGQVLTGKHGNPNTEELSVRYTGTSPQKNEGNIVGSVTVLQNSLKFQLGSEAGQTESLSVRSMRSNNLGTGVNNSSKFKSLKEVDLTSFQGAQDAIVLLDKAIEETSSTRANLGAFQKNTLESNIQTLRVAYENMTASESVIRDADIAHEMAEFTKNQILTQATTSMLAQANQQSRSVLSLIG